MKYIILSVLLFSAVLCHTQVPTKESVYNHKQIQLPYNRLIQPAGIQIFFGDYKLENHSLDASLSPDGKWLAVEERYSIVFISTSTNKVKFILPNSAHPDLDGGMNTYSGLIWHNTLKGPEVIWSSVSKDKRSFVVSASWDGEKAIFGRMIEYLALPPAKVALPNEILITNESGIEFLYVVLNGNNQVLKQNFSTTETVWSADPGVAPYGLTLANEKLYITNWAGRHPDSIDTDVAGVPWGLAKVDNISSGGATREGSVSVLNPSNGKIIKEIIVGLHPNEIISNKSGQFIYITNSNSDNVSVINTSRDEVCETVSVRLQPKTNPFFGDSPNGICLSHDEKVLYIANGMDNALAVIRLGKNASEKGNRSESTVVGFIPTGAYPSAINIYNASSLYVCNLEAEGVKLGLTYKDTDNPLYNTDKLVYNAHHMLASVSVIPIPGKTKLRSYTDTVIAVNNLMRAALSREKPRESVKPKPVPDRIGEPSVFKHIVYIIKENRTYDQVLGDMKQGNGDPGLCIFGELVTPNTHKLSEEFILFDNFNVSGKCSAEGHQWTDASIVTDYIEKNMREWFRSYPHVQEDALVYAPTGFLWDNATRNGKKVRIYGEASSPVFDNETNWSDVYTGFLRGEIPGFKNHTTIEPVKKLLSETYPSYGNHEFPDIVRADAFIKELKSYEEQEGDQLPELMILALPNDHTGGTKPGLPTPRAMVADNDLALGQIVEALSKSRFWKNTVIFVVEDDSQNGWDHVSAYRTVSLVISPYSRFRSVNSTYYTQPSIIRTIEQILGLPPMNIQDAIANTMTDCFGNNIDLTPYQVVKNRIPLNEMNPPLTSLNGRALYYAKKSMLPEFEGIDTGNDDLLNRILWFSAKGNTPYPAKFEGKEIDDEED